MTDLRQYRTAIERKQGQLAQLQTQQQQTQDKIVFLQTEIQYSEQAQAIIQQVAKETQAQLQYHISELCSLALSAVFDDPYELQLEFVIRRGKTEADIYFLRDGERMHPISASGGGAVDVASFALRIALWSLARPRTRSVMILDEPFIRLKGKEANRRVLDMVDETSKRMKMQIIMVSDERIPKEEIIERSDRVFEVSIDKGISHVEQL